MSLKLLNYVGLGLVIGEIKTALQNGTLIEGLKLSHNDLTDELLEKINAAQQPEALTALVSRVEALEAFFLENDSDSIVNKFPEVIALLDGLTEDQKLTSLLGDKASKSEIPTALKSPTSMTVKLNGGSTEGVDKFTYDGSAAKTVNITAALIGALTSSNISSATFEAGAFSGKTYNPTSGATTIKVPTKTSHLENDSGLLEEDDIQAITADEIHALFT